MLGKKDKKYKAGNSRGWKLGETRKTICSLDHDKQIQIISYHPFDTRFIHYHPEMVDWGREKIMRHFIQGGNEGLMCPKQSRGDWGAFVTSNIAAHKTVSAYDINYIFPLYLYVTNGSRVPNLNRDIISAISEQIGVSFVKDGAGDGAATFGLEDMLDYVYAWLHASSYREEFKDLLKSDFPRVPYPRDAAQFWALVPLGRKLRKLHLLEHPKVQQLITTYPEAGDDRVEKVEYRHGKVYINTTQYSGGVPKEAWEFWIGGYQPAQKWLKDRKGMTLTSDDIVHYQRMIAALVEMGRVMREIDSVVAED